MPDINPSIPVIGQSDSTEEPKIVTALTQLIAAVNDVDTDQIADGTIVAADLASNSVTTAKILDANVTAAKIEAQDSWHSLAFSGAGATWSLSSVGYMKDSLGFVHLRGAIRTSASPTLNTAFATLPAGYRPAQGLVLPVPNINQAGGTSGILLIAIDTSGSVFLQLVCLTGASLPWDIAFDGFVFRTA